MLATSSTRGLTSSVFALGDSSMTGALSLAVGSTESMTGLGLAGVQVKQINEVRRRQFRREWLEPS
jgi:hypothetical protein